MNASRIAAALATAIACAAPLAALAADDVRLAQAAPDVRGVGMGEMMGRDGDGMMGHRPGPGMMGGMMHRMMQLPPRQRCEEQLARRSGLIAYVVAKLNLTPEQRPLWDKLQAVIQAATDRERQLCTQLQPEADRSQETILDKLARREQFLVARLQGLQQVRPAVDQLYQVLTAEQKAVINHPFPGR